MLASCFDADKGKKPYAAELRGLKCVFVHMGLLYGMTYKEETCLLLYK